MITIETDLTDRIVPLAPLRIPPTSDPPCRQLPVSPSLLAAKTAAGRGPRGVQAAAPGRLARRSDLRSLTDLRDDGRARADRGGAGRPWPRRARAGFGEQIALVAHGGYGRRDVAPYRDVDLMILHAPGARRARGAAGRAAAARRVRRRADPRPQRADARAGLPAGVPEPMICTSLIESRLLGGSDTLFSRFADQLRRARAAPCRRLVAAIETRARAGTAPATARRSSCWSRTSSARGAGCATCS